MTFGTPHCPAAGGTRFRLLLVDGAFCVLAVFLLMGAFFLTGGLVAVIGLFLIGWAGLLRQLYVDCLGPVVGRRVDEFDGYRKMRLKIAVEQFGVYPELMFTTYQERPVLGDRVALLIPMYRRRRGHALMSGNGPLADGPVLLLVCRRTEFRKVFARPHRILFGRPDRAGRTADHVLDATAEFVRATVLGWHRACCKRLAGPMKDSLEFSSLSAAFAMDWDAMLSRSLGDIRECNRRYDETSAIRERVFRRPRQPLWHKDLYIATAASRALVFRRLGR